MRQSTSSRRQRGSIVIYLIAVLAVLAVISVAATSYFSSSMVSTATVNCEVNSQYLAEAGIRYAQGQLRSQTDLATLNAAITALTTPTFTVDGAGTFKLSATAPVDDGGFYSVTVTSIGTAAACDDPTTPTTNTQTAAVDTNISVGGGGGEEPDGDINFSDGIDGFKEAGEGGSQGDKILQTDTDNNNVSVGNGVKSSYGCLWYAKNSGGCTDGVCPFGSGLRAYFTAQLSPNTEGDGFVFAIVNSENNTTDSCGGKSSMGELLAYSGKGNGLDWVAKGLLSPKIGLEVDLYSNTGDGSACTVGNRNDAPESRDHVAWVFWGLPYDSNGCYQTFDDNQHGAGKWTGSGQPVSPSAEFPTNPENIGASGAGADGYYYDESNGSNWIREYNSSNKDKKFRIRVEIDRATEKNNDNNYVYALRGWIVRDDVDMPRGFANVNVDFYDPDNESTWPQVVHGMALDSTRHNKLDEIIFGWTVATGGATETIVFDNFHLSFKDDKLTCPATTKPDDFYLAVPFYSGQGSQIPYYLSSTSSAQSRYVANAYWLADKGCPGYASLYFSDDHGPFLLDHDFFSSDQSTGTVSAWAYLKDYKELQGILHYGINIDNEAFSLQLMADKYSSDFSTVRFNEDSSDGSNHYIDDGEKKPALCVTDEDDKTYCINSKYELELDKWYLLTATWDSGADLMQFFVNGEKTATFDIHDLSWNLKDVKNPGNSDKFLIGAQQDPNNASITSGSSGHGWHGGHNVVRDPYHFNGMIDDVYLYTRVLTDSEIMDLYYDGLHAAQ